MSRSAKVAAFAACYMFYSQCSRGAGRGAVAAMSSQLLGLADDLLQLCLGCLDAHDLSRCAAVSARLRQLSSTDALWRPHLQRLPGSAGAGQQLVAAPAAQGAAAAEAGAAAAAAPVPARLVFAAVSLLSAARLHAASAEARRQREKVLYNKVRNLSQMLRDATRRVDQSRSAQRAAAAQRQQLLAEEAVARMSEADAKGPGGWSLQRPRSPPPAAAHARAEQAEVRAASALRVCEAAAATLKRELKARP